MLYCTWLILLIMTVIVITIIIIEAIIRFWMD